MPTVLLTNQFRLTVLLLNAITSSCRWFHPSRQNAVYYTHQGWVRSKDPWFVHSSWRNIRTRCSKVLLLKPGIEIWKKSLPFLCWSWKWKYICPDFRNRITNITSWKDSCDRRATSSLYFWRPNITWHDCLLRKLPRCSKRFALDLVQNKKRRFDLENLHSIQFS